MMMSGLEAHFFHLAPLAGRGRIASAIRVRGSLRERGRNGFENARQILRDIIIPKPQNTIIVICKPFVANRITLAISMLSAVHLDNQAAFTTNEVDRVRPDRFLSDELIPTQPASAKTIPERPFRIRQRASQPPRTLGLGLIGTAHAETPPHPSRFARRPLPASGGEAKIARIS